VNLVKRWCGWVGGSAGAGCVCVAGADGRTYPPKNGKPLKKVAAAKKGKETEDEEEEEEEEEDTKKKTREEIRGGTWWCVAGARVHVHYSLVVVWRFSWRFSRATQECSFLPHIPSCFYIFATQQRERTCSSRHPYETREGEGDDPIAVHTKHARAHTHTPTCCCYPTVLALTAWPGLTRPRARAMPRPGAPSCTWWVSKWSRSPPPPPPSLLLPSPWWWWLWVWE
jgi:hypothetical protein